MSRMSCLRRQDQRAALLAAPGRDAVTAVAVVLTAASSPRSATTGR